MITTSAHIARALGRAIRETRQSRGLTQEELAASIGLHRTYVGDVERATRNVTVETLKRLADGLGIPMWKLVQMAETSSQ